MRLPLNVKLNSFKAMRDSNLIGGSVNLIVFKKCLDKKLKTLFNPLADFIAANDTLPKRPTKPYQPKPGTKSKLSSKLVSFSHRRVTIPLLLTYQLHGLSKT